MKRTRENSSGCNTPWYQSTVSGKPSKPEYPFP